MSTPFYDLASLVVVPSGYKASKVYAQKPLTTDGQLTFSRASTATRVNSAGLIETVSSNVPRLDYLGSACPKLLLEPQRTNLLLQSSAFDNASWIKEEMTISANASTSPDGTTSADKAIPSTAAAVHIVRQQIGTAASYSVYAKASGYNFLSIYYTVHGANARFDLSTGTIAQSTDVTAKIENMGNGWYRCSAVSNVTSHDSVWLIVSETTSLNFTGNGTDGVLLWGAQHEAGSYPTSLIQTTTAAVTRLGDDLSTNKLQSANQIGATAGTFFLQTVKTDDAIWINQRILLTSTTQRSLLIDTVGGQARLRTWDASSAGATITTSGLTNGVVKYLIKWDGTTVKVFANGVLRGSSAQPSYAYTTYSALESTSYSNNTISQLLFFNTALTDAQCIELTTL